MKTVESEIVFDRLFYPSPFVVGERLPIKAKAQALSLCDLKISESRGKASADCLQSLFGKSHQ